MANSFVTFEQIIKDLNLAIPRMAKEVGMTPTEFVVRAIKELNDEITPLGRASLK